MPSANPSPGLSRRGFIRLVAGATGGTLLYALLKPDPMEAGVLPPGALPRSEFDAACLRCGRCALVCEDRAIRLTPEGQPEIEGLGGWCDFCLRCVEACPTGALRPAEGPDEPRIGFARIDRARCIAWQWAGCRLCAEQCDRLYQAIWLDADLRPHVDEAVCRGCGACVFVCPQPAREGTSKRSGRAVSLRPIRFARG